MEHYNQDILTDFEASLELASTGKRFANYIIDFIFFYILIFLFAIVIGFVNPEWIDEINDSEGFALLDRLVGLLFYALYMFVFEAVFKGKTVGKLITGTRAVHEDGSPVSLKAAFLRGLSRAVPFEVLSAFGDPCYPWHDKWTDTYVIDIKKSGLQVR